MTLIGILSDTHGRLDEAAYAALAECDHIIHAGDIGGPSVLHELETLAPVTAVLGNNDFPEYGSNVQRFAHPVIEGVRFLVAHYPTDVRIGFNGCAGLSAGDPLPRVCVHGHTHVPKLETGASARPAQLLLCPGAVFRPRGGFPRCIAKMEVDDGRILRTHIEDLHGNVLFSWPAAEQNQADEARPLHADGAKQDRVGEASSPCASGAKQDEPITNGALEPKPGE